MVHCYPQDVGAYTVRTLPTVSAQTPLREESLPKKACGVQPRFPLQWPNTTLSMHRGGRGGGNQRLRNRNLPNSTESQISLPHNTRVESVASRAEPSYPSRATRAELPEPSRVTRPPPSYPSRAELPEPSYPSAEPSYQSRANGPYVPYSLVIYPLWLIKKNIAPGCTSQRSVNGHSMTSDVIDWSLTGH